MRVPAAAELIEVWERGSTQHWVDRAVSLLSVAYPERTFGDLQALTISERDRLLLDIHRVLFGRTLACYAECPECDARMEFAVDIHNLVSDAASSSKPDIHELASNDLLVRFCAPNSADLAALRACTDIDSARQLLLQRCIIQATRAGSAIPIAELPLTVVEEISSTLERCESDGDISIALQCVSCAHQWRMAFDIVSFLWAEISARARRFLNEVHTLAWAYGWREVDILGMSPARRQFYLDRVENG